MGYSQTRGWAGHGRVALVRVELGVLQTIAEFPTCAAAAIPGRPRRPWTVAEVADYLGIPGPAVQAELAAGSFPGAFRAGDAGRSSWRVPVSAVIAFMDLVSAPAEPVRPGGDDLPPDRR